MCMLKQEDRVYFWWKAVKALKSPGKPEKIQKIWVETGKRHFGVTERWKKICGKPEKAYFFCGKLETDPLFHTLKQWSLQYPDKPTDVALWDFFYKMSMENGQFPDSHSLVNTVTVSLLCKVRTLPLLGWLSSAKAENKIYHCHPSDVITLKCALRSNCIRFFSKNVSVQSHQYHTELISDQKKRGEWWAKAKFKHEKINCPYLLGPKGLVNLGYPNLRKFSIQCQHYCMSNNFYHSITSLDTN